MSDEQAIFNSLKDYEVSPPAGMLMRIADVLNIDFVKNNKEERPGLLDQLQELEIAPPSFLYSTLEKKVLADIHLSFLKHFESAPPAEAFDAIIKNVEKEKTQRKFSITFLSERLYRYQSAAAVILLVAIGWFVYQIARKPAKPTTEVAVKKVQPIQSKNDSALTGRTIRNEHTIAAVTKKKKRQTISAIESVQEKVIMSIDDYNFPVVDNDLLATFASFNYSQLPPFIKDPEKKEFTIRTDQYAAILVSESMTKMIRRMNLFRNNGRLTNRAKRTRSTLEKWKKADAEHFDKSLVNNPLDALDLAEFIFK